MRLYPDTYRTLLSDVRGVIFSLCRLNMLTVVHLQLRAEKEKFAHWKDKLEKERNEAYAQVSSVRLLRWTFPSCFDVKNRGNPMVATYHVFLTYPNNSLGKGMPNVLNLTFLIDCRYCF